MVNKGGYYMLPIKDLTNKFCKKLLAGDKKLIKVSFWIY